MHSNSLLKLATLVALITVPVSVSANPKMNNGTITGSITDKSTGRPIAGASISIPDLKIVAVADSEGHYVLRRLPKGRYLIQVTAVGFAGWTEVVDLSGSSRLDFQLAPSWNTLADAVVTSLGNATSKLRTP